LSKVKLTIELDDTDFYDSQAIKALTSASEGERKGMLVSGLLYWLRSPSFQLIDKIDLLLERLGDGPLSPSLLPQPAPRASQITALSPKQALPLAPVSTEAQVSDIIAKDIPEEFSDGADDAFSSLFEESS